MTQGYHPEGDAPNRPDRTLPWEDLPGLFPEFSAPGRWLPLLQRHAAILEAAAPRVRVTAVLPEDAVRRHFAESLELLRLAGGAELEGPLVDVGSGGGFPGLVIAAVMPSVEMHLVEPLQRRAALLEEAARALELDAVTVHALRAEEAGRGPLRDSAGTVMARAVAPLRELLEYTAPLCRVGGRLLLPKGSGLREEIEDAGHALAELGCAVESVEAMRPRISETIAVVRLRKRGVTPGRYPRRAGVPGKRPL